MESEKMKCGKICLVFLYFLIIRSAYSSDPPCSFNERECTCVVNPPPGEARLWAVCESLTSALPSFSTTPDLKNVSGLTIVSDSVNNIPSRYFAVFEKLTTLSLYRSTPDLSTQNWHDDAFAGVNINYFGIVGLAGVIPPPVALRRLNATLLQLTVTSAITPIRLEDSSFEGFYHFERLYIWDTIIEKIGASAFAGLEGSLIDVGFRGTSLTAFSFDVFKNLTKLNSINLSDNPLTTISGAALPQKLRIFLKNTSLTSFDLSAFDGSRNLSIIIDNNKMLKNLTVTDPYQAFGYYVSCSQTSLEFVDPKVGDILNRSPDLTLAIEYNYNFLCQDVAWMFYHVYCTRRLSVKNTTCADRNNQLLSEYLSTIAPYTCSEITTAQAMSTVGTSPGPTTRNPATVTVVTSANPSSHNPGTVTSPSPTTRNPITGTNPTTWNPMTVTKIVTPSSPTPSIKPCPFNENECNCTDIAPPDQLVFSKADCASLNSRMPNFTTPTNSSAKFTITGTLTVNGNVSDIPARHFLAFKTIGALELTQSKGPYPLYQKWNELAFDVVRITSFAVTGLEGVLPPAQAIRRLGGRGLKVLIVLNSSAPVFLDDYSFDAFPSLTTLSLLNNNIVRIADNAFLGVEDHLVSLTIRGSSLIEFPSFALSGLINLEALGFEESTVTTMAFLQFPQLISLSLSGDINLGLALSQGALDQASPKLISLRLNKTGLQAVPRDLAKNQPLLQYLDLSSNLIETIKSDDFRYCGNLTRLQLEENPLRNIESGAFLPLNNAHLINLEKSELMSIDLSIFAKVRDDATLNLASSAQLKSITVSITNQFPSQARIDINNAGLEAIDCKINDLLKRYTNVSIDISDNDHLLCNVHAWMTNVACPVQLKIDDARCADKNGQLLSEYLKNIMPNTTCTVS